MLQNCQFLQLFIRDSFDSNSGHWSITDCQPDNAIACGGVAHQLLIGPNTNSNEHCPHDIPSEGWVFCTGNWVGPEEECDKYEKDDTISFDCFN